MTLAAPLPDARPVVVLLHSSMSSQAQWSALCDQLETQFRCIAVDLLGYGQSPYPSHAVDGFSLPHEVEAVEALLAAQLAPGQPFHLVGHSYGGATALRMARQMPERILSLTVFEPAAFHLLPLDHAGRIEIETVVAAILRTGSEHEATRIFIDYWNRPGTFEFIGGEQRDKFAAQIAKVKLDFQALLGERASLADMAQLKMPVLVLSGQTSPESTRALAQLLTAVLPNGSTAQTKGGHMAPLTHAYLVNPVIADFLNAIATKLKHSED